VDPLQKKYPQLTPYQFASNRPIDGVDLDGREYITFHVTITKGSDGQPVFNKTISQDFRGMSAEQMAQIHNNSSYAQNFYKQYSESFGPEGRGFKWVYYDENGKQMGEPVWQMRQSKYLNFTYSGYYSGPGSITKYGPGPSNTDKFSYLSNGYDFGYSPMGYSDKISKSHDFTQNEAIKQPQGWLEDVRTLSSDIELLQAAKDGLVGGAKFKSKEDRLRTQNIATFFSAVIAYKEWKASTMIDKGYDITKTGDQLKVILSDWKPETFSADWFAKIILMASGGGASEKERNTVKPPPQTKP
jgi:hypothetical protein